MKMPQRKFVLMIGVFTVTTTLLWFGKVDQATWMYVVNPTVIAYLAANVTQKALARRNGNSK